MTGAEFAEQVETVPRPDAGAQRPVGRGLDHRPVGDRIGEGDADLDHVGAARDEPVEDRSAGLDIGVAEGDERAEGALPGRVQPREHVGVAIH